MAAKSPWRSSKTGEGAGTTITIETLTPLHLYSAIPRDGSVWKPDQKLGGENPTAILSDGDSLSVYEEKVVIRWNTGSALLKMKVTP